MTTHVNTGDSDGLVTVVVDLQQGFVAGRRVTIEVDGQVVFESDHVVSDPMLGIAESIPVEVRPGTHEVVLRAGSVERSVAIDVTAALHVGFDLDRDDAIVSDEPFGYA